MFGAEAKRRLHKLISARLIAFSATEQKLYSSRNRWNGHPAVVYLQMSERDTMAAIAFDTPKFARKLKAAGVPDKQTEAQAEIMAEAFLLNMDALVTKDYLDARFAQQEARMDACFAEQDARIDTRFGQVDTRFAEVNGKFRLVMWMLAVVMASTVIPAVSRLLS